MNRKKNQLLAFPYIFWMAGFTIIPLLMMLYYGLTNREGAFTLENILAIGSPEHLKALVLSLILAAVSTLICLLLAYPLALILRNRHIGQGSFIVFIFILPMWMNFLLRTLAWQTLLEKSGVITGYHATVDPVALGYHITAFINLTLDPKQKDEFYPYVTDCPNVLECNCVTGLYSIMLKVAFPSTMELDTFIGHLQKYGNTQTQIVFSTAVPPRGIHLPQEEEETDVSQSE